MRRFDKSVMKLMRCAIVVAAVGISGCSILAPQADVHEPEVVLQESVKVVHTTLEAIDNK